jgi:predicted HNH restriction endonuclease
MKSEMVLIGDVTEFDQTSIAKMIESYLKGGGDMDNLQKNENDATITNMSENHLESHTHTIDNDTTAVMNIVKQVASSMVPQFNIFTTTGTSTTGASNAYTLTVDEAMLKTEAIVEKSEVSDETVEGGEEVNTEELLKSLSSMMDEKLNEFKTDIVATVDEKIETVSKAVEVSEADADESLLKGDESKVDEKDELIKSLTERLDALETKGAIKKSLDDDSSDNDEVITKNTKSVWDGMFIPTEVVNALGYES